MLKKRIIASGGLLLLGVTLILGFAFQTTQAKQVLFKGGQWQPVDADELHRTDVYPTLDFPLDPLRNQIYCDTMEHAWKKLNEMSVLQRVRPVTLIGAEAW